MIGRNLGIPAFRGILCTLSGHDIYRATCSYTEGLGGPDETNETIGNIRRKNTHARVGIRGNRTRNWSRPDQMCVFQALFATLSLLLPRLRLGSGYRVSAQYGISHFPAK